ncbi:MAG: hypothetical protein AAFU49_04525 [Pseudomonadota bacterium]
MGEDVLDRRTDRGHLRGRPRGVPGHRLARRLATVDAADHQALRQPGLVAL